MRVCQEGLEGQEEDEQEVTQGEKDLLAAHSLAMVTLGRQSQGVLGLNLAATDALVWL